MGGSVVEFSPSHLKQQENLPKAVNNETDLCSLTVIEFKRERVSENTEGIKRGYEQ